jgi:hypothetical protein
VVKLCNVLAADSCTKAWPIEANAPQNDRSVAKLGVENRDLKRIAPLPGACHVRLGGPAQAQTHALHGQGNRSIAMIAVITPRQA